MAATDVVITHHERIEEAMSAALQHITLGPLITGRLVAIKPNETWASEDDTTGITLFSARARRPESCGQRMSAACIVRMMVGRVGVGWSAIRCRHSTCAASR